VPIPSPSKGEVLIRMEATSVNQVDWRFQKGVARPVMPRKFPFISCNTRVALGQRVTTSISIAGGCSTGVVEWLRSSELLET